MDTINDRIKKIRKDKKMSQKDMANEIGISQRAMSWGEQPGNNVQDSTIKGICRAYNVNEEWLRFGTGSMYIEPETFSMDSFIKENQIDKLESDIIRAYFEISPEARREVLDKFKAAMGINPSPWDEAPDTPEELERQFPPIETEDASGNAG